MTIAICTAGELFGGVERHVLGLCEYARRVSKRFPLLVLFYEGELARQARQIDLEPVVLRGRGRYDPQLVTALAETLDSHDVSVVHAHGYKAMITSALAKRQLGKRGGAPFTIVKTEHGKLEPMDGNPATWARLCLNKAADVVATRMSADVVCYVTNDLAASSRRFHGSLRRVVIPNGIDPLERAAYPRPADLEPAAAHIGIVGRLTQIKGIQFALHALANPTVPTHTVLNIVGTGPLEPYLQQEAHALGLGSRVRFLGFRADVWNYLAHLDALLLPSLHEGLPYTLLESMSLQTPIIASRVGGLAEVLRHGETGLLFSPGDVDQLAHLIARVVNDPTWAQSIGASAGSAQRRHLTLDHMGDRYWHIFATAAGAA
jgi:L-malate glycosyltransferase